MRRETIPLEPPKLPAWLERFHLLIRLAGEGSQFAEKTRLAIRASSDLSLKPLDAWFTRVREANLPDDVAKNLDQAYEEIAAAAKPETIRKLYYAIERAAEVVHSAAGAVVRSLSDVDHAVRLAIVSVVYRYETSSEHGGVCVSFDDGRDFGINGQTLRRFVGVLMDEGIFEYAGGPDTVRITESGMKWFERQVREESLAEVDEEGMPVNVSPGFVDVAAVETHLSFMKKEELRAIAFQVLGEINETVYVRASLATMALCGSLVEAMLLDLAEQVPNKFVFAETKNWAEKVSLTGILKELNTLKLVTDTALGMVIADHRDLIHPHRRRHANIRVDPKTARAMVSLVEIVAHDLFDAARRGRLEELRNQ